MAKPKRMSSYPEIFLQLANSCAQTHTLAFASRRDAENFRFDFYGFRASVRRDGVEEQFPHLMRAQAKIIPANGEFHLTIGPPEHFAPKFRLVSGDFTSAQTGRVSAQAEPEHLRDSIPEPSASETRVSEFDAALNDFLRPGGKPAAGKPESE